MATKMAIDLCNKAPQNLLRCRFNNLPWSHIQYTCIRKLLPLTLPSSFDVPCVDRSVSKTVLADLLKPLTSRAGSQPLEMHPALAKTPAYKYAKEFSISSALANLQAYKLATGQVNAGDISQVKKRHGQDESALFGELITMASGKESTHQHSEPGVLSQEFAGKRRRKRKKAHDHHSSDDSPSDWVKGSVPTSSAAKRGKKMPPKRPAVHSLVAIGYGSSSDAESSEELSGQAEELLPAPEIVLGTNCSEEKLTDQSCTDSEVNRTQPIALHEEGQSDSRGEDGGNDFFGVNDSSEDDVDETIFLGCKAYRVRQEDVSKAQAQEERERQRLVMKARASDAPYVSSAVLTADQVSKGSWLDLPENRPTVWDFKTHRWKNRGSSLTTYKCWKCNRVGHFPEDCVATINTPAAHPALPGVFTQEKSPGQQVYSKLLRDYYAKCRRLQQRKDASCADCGAHSNLCHCLDCGMTFCDGRGHLAEHLLQHLSHNKLYSFKLRRQLKCCKPTCEVMDVTELLACSACLSTIFDRHYSMINATWSAAGLKAIPNALCCDDHFHWHRVNCISSSSDRPFSQENLKSHRHSSGLISEFFL